MLTVHLRRFFFAHQRQGWPLFLLIWAGGLSLHFTVRACHSLSLADSALEIAALGSLYEIAKLSFGPRAILGIWNAPRAWVRVGHVGELALVLALMAGSVGASFAYTTHVEAQAVAAADATRANALSESDTHKALSKDIETYDARIAGLLESASLLRAANQPTKAGEKDKLVAELQAQKNEAVTRRAAMRGAGLPAAATASGITRWIHLALAVALEMIGVVAGVWFHAARAPAESREQPMVMAQNAGSGGGTVLPIDATRRSVAAHVHSAGQTILRKRFMMCQAEASRLIESGTMRPTLDALWARFGVSQRPAKRILEALCAEGVIWWDGRRYQRSHAAAS